MGGASVYKLVKLTEGLCVLDCLGELTAGLHLLNRLLYCLLDSLVELTKGLHLLNCFRSHSCWQLPLWGSLMFLPVTPQPYSVSPIHSWAPSVNLGVIVLWFVVGALGGRGKPLFLPREGILETG